MIVSFHPLFEGDKNIICAGREPDASDLSAIKAADAVILPQGCRQNLYEMARDACEHVFPNYDARFRYPGKIGQIRLFEETQTLCPQTETYSTLNSFYRRCNAALNRLPFQFPFVFKLDWGGEGDTVYFIPSLEILQHVLQHAAICENSGQKGFLVQEYIPNHKTLRVVIIGCRLITYWRSPSNQNAFLANLSKGATIDFESDPDLQAQAIVSIKDFCNKSGINLAGVDVVFSSDEKDAPPLLLEINYFFGRTGLGGSARYYTVLHEEIRVWLKNLGLDK